MKKLISLVVMSAFCMSVFSQLLCDPSLWTHMYNPERLSGEKKCTTVRGKVWSVKATDDGGYRLFIKLDPGQPVSLLNDKNISLAKGCLVAEIICAHRPITQPDALKACGTFENKIRVPALNDAVQVAGTYMLDTDSTRGWNTLYPVSAIFELPKR